MLVVVVAPAVVAGVVATVVVVGVGVGIGRWLVLLLADLIVVVVRWSCC